MAGDIRELENVLERALIVTNGSTLSGDAFLKRTREDAFAGASLDDMQRAHILSVLRQCGGKVAGKGNAAERLGMKRGTLQFRMKKLGICRAEAGAQAWTAAARPPASRTSTSATRRCGSSWR